MPVLVSAPVPVRPYGPTYAGPRHGDTRIICNALVPVPPVLVPGGGSVAVQIGWVSSREVVASTR